MGLELRVFTEGERECELYYRRCGQRNKTGAIVTAISHMQELLMRSVMIQG